MPREFRPGDRIVSSGLRGVGGKRAGVATVYQVLDPVFTRNGKLRLVNKVGGYMTTWWQNVEQLPRQFKLEE